MNKRALPLVDAERGMFILALPVAFVLAYLAANSPQRAIYLVIAAVAVLLVFKSLLAGLALFIVLTFPDRLPGALEIGPTLAKPLGIVLLISWLLAIVSDRERQIPFLPRDAPVLTYTLLALLVWCTASLLWASDRSLTLHDISRLAQLVSLVFVTYSAVRKPRDLLILVWALLIGALVTSVFALSNGTLNGGRLTGGIFDPNDFAMEMVVALTVGMFLLVAAQRASVRVVLLALLVPIAVALVETQSRSGLIALAAACFAAVLVAGPWRGRMTAVILLTVSVGLGYYLYAAPPQLRERVRSIGSASQASPARADTWHIALRVTKDHPILGVGLGNFPAVESRYIIGNVDIVDVRKLRHLELVVHNTYLEVPAELGFVGFILFTAVIGMTIGRAVVMLTHRGSEEDGGRFLARAIIASAVGVMTWQIFISGEYSKQLWLLLGMSVAAASLGFKRQPQSVSVLGSTSSALVHVPAN